MPLVLIFEQVRNPNKLPRKKPIRQLSTE